MPNLDDYKNMLSGEHDDKDQVRIKDGNLSKRGIGSKIGGLLSGNRHEENETVLKQFRDELAGKYGDTIADLAMERSGLEEKLGRENAGPLTMHRMAKAFETADTLQADKDHKATLNERDVKAESWDPGASLQTSSLSEKEQTGLRMHTVDTNEMQIHAWHPCNRDKRKGEKDVANMSEVDRELDKAVLAEMQSIRDRMKENTPDDRILNLQARLNLLDKMVDQAANQEQQPGKTQVFIAPEWLFSGMEGQDGSGNKMSGGALTEKEMQRVTEGVMAISEKHKDMVIVPGSILWSKPLEKPIEVNGKLTPGDMLFNSAPSVQNGKLLGMTYKQTEGIDCELSKAGLKQNSPYELPAQANQYQSRLQIFPYDNTNSYKEDESVKEVQQQMKEMFDPKNASEWQTGMRKDAPKQEANHVIQIGGKTIAVEICGDHNNNKALENVQGLMNSSSDLGEQVKISKGVDGHLVVSTGVALRGGSCVSKQGGTFVGTDMSEGVVTSTPVNSVREGGGCMIGAKKTIGRISSEEKPPTVALDTKIPSPSENKLSNSSSLKNSF